MEGLKSELGVKGGTDEDWDLILSEGIKFAELSPYVAGSPGAEGPLVKLKATLFPGRVVEYQCFDARWREQGRAIFEVVGLEDEDKALMKGIHVCASDGYYEYYAGEKLSVDGCLYHFCSCPAKHCGVKLRSRDRRELIHVDQWKVTNAAQMVGNGFSATAGLSRARDGVTRFVPHPVLPPGPKKDKPEVKGSGLDEVFEKLDDEELVKEAPKKKRKQDEAGRSSHESPGGTVGGLLAGRAQRVAEDSARLEAKRKRPRKADSRKGDRAKRKGHRRSDSESDEDGSSDEDSESSLEVFRSPPTRGRGDLFRLAKKYPGRLLKSGLKEMGHYLAERIGGDPEAGWQDRKVMAYINQVLLVQHPPQQLGLRNLREAQTLGQALDLIMEGQIAKAGDLLMQRLKALETVNDQGWQQARHMELIAPQAASLAKVTEKEQAAKSELRAAKLKGLMAKKTIK